MKTYAAPAQDEPQRLASHRRDHGNDVAPCADGYRDLFEEAPIAYVHEGLDSRLIRANRAAMKLLGITPAEIGSTYGTALVPHTPEAQRRVREALASIGAGTATTSAVLELRRHDDGEPLWIQWWSSPDRSGRFTRTMFIDITDRVLAEQGRSWRGAQTRDPAGEVPRGSDFGGLIGASPGLRHVTRQVELVAPTDATVLITGESGTGKELVARAIHEHSRRRTRALVRINCGAVPEALFESEFFGHVRGAFTGALQDRAGRFELADGGSLLLDEIGEVPLAMQVKLLRVLQEQELERVGDSRTRKIDVRIIAATNRDLRAEVAAGRFRQDLYYRLTVFPIEIPPLRQRREDIPALAEHFVERSARRLNRAAPELHREAMEQLVAHDWPGNVRELQNAVERAIILSPEGLLHFDLCEPPLAGGSPTPSRDGRTAVLLTRADLKRQERDNIAAALARSGGKVFGPGGAAQLLGMKPTTLASRIAALGLHDRTGP